MNQMDIPQGWKKLKLKDILDEGSKEKVKDISKYQKLTIKLNFKGVEKAKVRENMADKRPFYVRKEGEIVIGKQNYFNGSIAILPEELDGGICSNAIMSFITKKDFNNKYVYYMLSDINFINKRSFLANGTGQKELSEKDFLDFDVIIPRIEEQEKIVKILENLDFIINKLNKEIIENEKIIEYIFNTAIKRYKTESIKIKKIVEYKKGYAFKSKEYKNKGCRVIRVSDLGEKYIKDECEKIFIDEFQKNIFQDYELKENDLIITTVGSKPPIYSSVAGRVIRVDKYHDGCLLNQNTVRLRTDKKILPRILYYQLRTKKYYDYLDVIMRGNANQGNITIAELLDYEVKIINQDLQIKLEKVLENIENTVLYKNEKIKQYEKLKTSLMQQLLTGKVRVKI